MAHFFGYDFGSRQQGIVLRHFMNPGSAEVLTAIDAWVLGRFGLKPDSDSPLTMPEPGDGAAMVRAVSERALLLYRELALAARLPIFAPGKVLAVNPAAPEVGAGDGGGDAENRFQVTVRLSVVDSFLQNLFTELYHDVLGMVSSAMAEPPTDESAAELETAIKEGWLATARSALPFRDSDLHMCRIAFENDIPFRHLGHGTTLMGWGRRTRLLNNGSIEQDSAPGSRIAVDKQYCVQLLVAAGFPATENILATSPETALMAAKALGWPVVVKPLSLSRSEGVTLGITSEEALVEAYGAASAVNRQVVVERHIAGTPHRIAIADGKMVYAVGRYPKGVRGDGERTVAELIEAENARRAVEPAWKRLDPLPTDEMAQESLAKMGLNLDAVPDKDVIALLRPMHGREWGGVIADVCERIHPDNVRLAVDVASLLGLTFAGVDLMSTDISVPWYENDARINEVNFRPQFATAARKLDLTGVISALAEGDGRIPVHLVTGQGPLLDQGRIIAQKARDEGRACFLTSATLSEDSAGNVLALTARTLFERSVAMLMRKDVDELVMVDERGELASRGFPVDRLASLHVMHPNPEARQALGQQIARRVAIGNPQSAQED